MEASGQRNIGLLFIIKYVIDMVQLMSDWELECKLKRYRLLCSAATNIKFQMDKRTGRIWMYQRTGSYWESDVPSFTDSEWIDNFRMTKKAFHKLLAFVYEDIKPDDKAFRKPIPADKRMAIAIYKLASLTGYGKVAQTFGVSDSSVYNCLYRFCRAIIERLGAFISMPNEEEAKNIATRFNTKYCFPQVMGCIDGFHIAVAAPEEGRKDFLNRAGWDSMILQVVVDDKFLFRNINITMPGSAHNSTVLRNSELYKHADQLFKAPISVEDIEVPLLIFGDSSYPLLPWLITPFAGQNLSPEKESFNSHLNSTRIVVETAFGRLKSRWRILGKKVEASIHLSPLVISTCCALHNFCEKSNMEIKKIIPDAFEDIRSIHSSNLYHVEDLEGNSIRNALSRHLRNTFPK